MIGLVVVSHSRPLAEAAVALAAQMVSGAGPTIEIAAGTADGGLGTDATAIAAAIERADAAARGTSTDGTRTDGTEPADGADGVLVFVDLGSAILSTQLALEFLDPDVAARTHVSAAPFVEGLFAAVVTASTGATADAVRREADGAAAAKAAQLTT